MFLLNSYYKTSTLSTDKGIDAVKFSSGIPCMLESVCVYVFSTFPTVSYAYEEHILFGGQYCYFLLQNIFK